MADCIFCGIIAGSIPSQRVYEDDTCVAFMDINPATRGHLLVVPRRHADDLTTISDDDLAACMRAAKTLVDRTLRVFGADGVNILNSCGAAAWQTVFHFHLHVIPRYRNDPLQLPWQPAPGDMDAISADAAALRTDDTPTG